MPRVMVCGSIATDHLMVFAKSFTDYLVPESLDRISLSFLADDLQIRRGGVGANICYGLGSLGADSILVGAVGADFAEYRRLLEERGVDTTAVRVSAERHTARFVCTTDCRENQIATFYAGAMTEAADIDLGLVVADCGAPDLVVVAADDPAAMVRHTRACRSLGVPVAADPSQQLARMAGADIRELVDGAAYLFGNEYEKELLCRSTGWSRDEVLERVGTWVTTLGAGGVRIEQAGRETLEIPAVPATVVDPTGGGDAFRAGFLAAWSWGFDLADAARVGCALAAEAIEALGGQGYELRPEQFVERFAGSYGADIARRLAGHLAPGAVPAATAEW
ncbi:MAG: carbohydrate kinase family protein [Catenulispora sp.]|nr:carbohydrate kinase family protein [Catenulispora sp.]